MNSSRKKKKVGVTMRVVETKEYREPRDAISHDWIDFLEHHALDFFLIPNRLKDPSGFFIERNADLLLLTNGNDPGSCPDRDSTEKALLDLAVQKKMPVLGICRGMQFINSFFGGKITPVDGHAGGSHIVRISDRRLRDQWGAEETLTNSYHNWGVRREDLAPDLKEGAVAENRLVEALYHKDLPILGVQWHPERAALSDPLSLKIVQKWTD